MGRIDTVSSPISEMRLGFDGTTAYSNGADTSTGYSCAGPGAYGYRYQCVELVMRPEQFDAFCRAQHAEPLPDQVAARLEHERRKWHECVPGSAG